MPLYVYDCVAGQAWVYATNAEDAMRQAIRQTQRYGIPYPTKLRQASGADIVTAISQGKYIPKEEDPRSALGSSTKP